MKGYLTSSQFGALLVAWVALLAITINGLAVALPASAIPLDYDEHEELGVDSYYQHPLTNE